MNCILSELVRTNKMICVDDFNVTAPKTKAFISEIKKTFKEEINARKCHFKFLQERYFISINI